VPGYATDKLLASLERHLLKESVVAAEVKLTELVRHGHIVGEGDEAALAARALTQLAHRVNPSRILKFKLIGAILNIEVRAALLASIIPALNNIHAADGEGLIVAQRIELCLCHLRIVLVPAVWELSKLLKWLLLLVGSASRIWMAPVGPLRENEAHVFEDLEVQVLH